LLQPPRANGEGVGEMPVYFIGQVEGRVTSIKIGVARDIQRRRQTLQTANPVPLEILGWIESENDFRLEKEMHKEFDSKRRSGEWFAIEPAEILSVLKRAGRKGFIAKNEDAFQIIGYDQDAIPEYLGVWEWGDLETEECCPFCGCFCGMHFQDASSMYYCINCDTLTNFSELSTNDDERE
jgi:hypothetical protein